MSVTSDEELVLKTTQGDESALLALYDRHGARVYALALKVLGEQTAAEEVTQDVFMKLWERGSSFDRARGGFPGWLLTIAKRAAIDRLRYEKRRPSAQTTDEADEPWRSTPPPTRDSDEARWRSLYFALQALPNDQRQVVELAYYYGLSHSDIAEHLGWPLGTVKTRLRLGMEQLRRAWLEEKNT